LIPERGHPKPARLHVNAFRVSMHSIELMTGRHAHGLRRKNTERHGCVERDRR
jgi:hypothetical protein